MFEKRFSRPALSWTALACSLVFLGSALSDPPTPYRYVDAKYRAEHVFSATPDEIVVRFDGNWSAEDRSAFEEAWGLTDAEAVDADIPVGVYRVAGRAAVDLARDLEATPPSGGRSVRAHIGLVENGAGKARFVPGQLMVQFKSGVSQDRIDAVLAREGVGVLRTFFTQGYLLVGYASGRKLFDVVTRFNSLPEISFACPDAMGFNDELYAPNDPLYPLQWAYNNTGQLGGSPGADVQAEDAWNVTLGDSLVLIAIVDSGVDLTHEDLAGAAVQRPVGHDWTFDSPDSTGQAANPFWHGTAVASVVSGKGNNGIGLTGIAPKASILPLRTRVSSGFLSQRIDAINYATTWTSSFPRLIINCSWKSDVDDPGLRAAIDNAVANGCIVMAAAGNDGFSQLFMPARYPNVFAVGSSTVCDTRASSVNPNCPVDSHHSSHHGAGLDVIAPGVDIQLCDLMGAAGQGTGNYVNFYGTSFACPLAAGAAALVWSIAPNLSGADVENVLRNSAEDQVGDPEEDTPGWDEYHGYGRLNAWQALLETDQVVGHVRGRVHDAADVVKLNNATLSVVPGLGSYAYRMASTPFNAQAADTVHVTGIVTLHTTADIQTTGVEFGLVTRAQRDAAIPSNPSSLFNQGVFMRFARDSVARRAAPGDYTRSVAGGAGETQPAEPQFAFDLMLVPSDSTGGMAYLSIDGAPYGTGHPYGVDNRTALGQSFPAEDFSEAYLIAQMQTTAGAGGSVSFRNVRVGVLNSGYGHALSDAVVQVLETGQQTSTNAQGEFSLFINAFQERTLVLTAPPYATADTLQFNMTYADTFDVGVGLEHVARAAVQGRFRAVAAVAALEDTAFAVSEGTPYAYALSSAAVNAQAADTVHVTGVVAAHSISDLDSTVVEIGLVSRAARDSALVVVGDPADLFDQSVFVRLWDDTAGVVVAAADFSRAVPGGVGDSTLVPARFTFDLRLVPSDSTGGTASISVDGAPYSPPIPYGVDNGRALGGSYPAENLSEAYLLAQMRTLGQGGSVSLRNVRVEIIDPGYGEPLAGTIESIGSSEQATAGPDGTYELALPGLQELSLRFSAPEATADTLTAFLAHRDTLFQPVGLVRPPRGTLAGRVRSVTNVVELEADTLAVNPGLGTTYAYAITPAPIDAQLADTVYVTGTITSFEIADLDTTRVELGLITRAQRDSALVTVGDPALMFDQAVFVRASNLGDTVGVAPADYDASFPGGRGAVELAPSTFTFELRLVPSDTTGGFAQLSIDGRPYGTPHEYGVDNGNNFGGMFPREDLAEAYLLVQLRSLEGNGGSVGFRNVRVETVEAGDAGPIVASVTDEGSGASAACDATGGYSLLTTAGSPRTIVYSALGYVSDTLAVQLTPNQTLFQPLGLRPTPRGSVMGHVTVGLSSLSDVQVRYAELSLALADTSDANGNYQLREAPVGTYSIRAQGAGYGPRRFRNIEVEPETVGTLSFDIIAGFDDDLEFGQGAWTHAAGDTVFADEWHLSTQRNATSGGTASWKCGGAGSGDYAATNYSILVMPPVRVQPNHVLEMQHWIDASTILQTIARHGGRLEASTDGGESWTVLSPIGGYPFHTPVSYGGPLGGDTPIFSGTHGFEESRFPVNGYTGQLTSVRFVFAADETGTPGEGWYVDDIVLVVDGTVAVDDLIPPALERVELFANAPNPFNPRTRIAYFLPSAGLARLQVFDVAGRLIVRLADGQHEAGRHEVVWDGRTEAGLNAGSGVYYYELRTPKEHRTRQMLLLK